MSSSALLNDLRSRLADAQLALRNLRAAGQDDDATLDALGRAEQRRVILTEQITKLEAEERATAHEREAAAARRERARMERDLEARREALSLRWAVWGSEVARADAVVRQAWREYPSLAQEALQLARDAAAAGIEIGSPDTSPAASIMADIVAGRSPIKDWRAVRHGL